MDSWSRLLAVSVFLCLLLTVSIPWVCASSEDDATMAVTDAENVFSSTFEAVLDAERVGADVSELLGKLNLGSEYLVEAIVCYRLGDFGNASRFAGLCVEAVGSVKDEAVELRHDAEGLLEADFVARLFGSIVGVVVVLVVGFVVWRVFRKHYFKRVRGLRPEVGSGES